MKLNQLMIKNHLDHLSLVEVILQLLKKQNNKRQQHSNNKVLQVILVASEAQTNQLLKQFQKRQNKNRKFSPNNRVLNSNPQVVVSNVVVLLVSSDE